MLLQKRRITLSFIQWLHGRNYNIQSHKNVEEHCLLLSRMRAQYMCIRECTPKIVLFFSSFFYTFRLLTVILLSFSEILCVCCTRGTTGKSEKRANGIQNVYECTILLYIWITMILTKREWDKKDFKQQQRSSSISINNDVKKLWVAVDCLLICRE